MILELGGAPALMLLTPVSMISYQTKGEITVSFVYLVKLQAGPSFAQDRYSISQSKNSDVCQALFDFDTIVLFPLIFTSRMLFIEHWKLHFAHWPRIYF